MKSRLRCKTCRGIYDTQTADGAPYQHACPPIDASLVLESDGTTTLVKPGTEGVRPILRSIVLNRPNYRDERLTFADPTQPAQIISAGTGTTPLPSTAPAVDPSVTS